MATTGLQVGCFLDLQLRSAGRIKGDSTTHGLGRKDLIQCWSFHHAVRSPSDASSGQVSGGRMEIPIVVVTPLGSASVPLFKGLISGDPIVKGIFTFYRHDRAGKEKLFYRITIEDGWISDFSTRLPNVKATDQVIHDEFHEVEFSYRKITHENVELGMVAVDDAQGFKR
jgi:type VI secretion system secreted protein Hcp